MASRTKRAGSTDSMAAAQIDWASFRVLNSLTVVQKKVCWCPFGNVQVKLVYHGGSTFQGESILLKHTVMPLICFGLTVAVCVGQDQPQSSLVRMGVIKSPLITESSGLVRAGVADDFFWTINDSGNAAEVYLIHESGAHRATLKLPGARNRDWESMTTFNRNGTRYLVVGDVGDNGRRRESCTLYWFPEPEFALTNEGITEVAARPRAIEFSYADGPRDCEAIAVDPRNGRLWLVEKIFIDDRRGVAPGVYTLPLPTRNQSGKMIARRVANYPARNVTGMDISSDGRKMLVRTYVRGHWFERGEDEGWDTVLKRFQPSNIALPLQRQGEAICLSADAQTAFLTSESRRQPFWKIHIQRQLEIQRKSKTEKPGK